jgi:hypothetical protein
VAHAAHASGGVPHRDRHTGPQQGFDVAGCLRKMMFTRVNENPCGRWSLCGPRG